MFNLHPLSDKEIKRILSFLELTTPSEEKYEWKLVDDLYSKDSTYSKSNLEQRDLTPSPKEELATNDVEYFYELPFHKALAYIEDTPSWAYIRRYSWPLNTTLHYVRGRQIEKTSKSLHTGAVHKGIVEDNKNIKIKDHLDLLEDTQVHVGWLPSLEDLLATDWEIHTYYN